MARRSGGRIRPPCGARVLFVVSNSSGLQKGTVRKFWEFTLVGLALGVVLGWLLSLVSGNYFVVIAVGILGTVIGIILGIIHRNDP